MTPIGNRPDLDASEVLDAVREHYGLDGTMTPLTGDRDWNYLLLSDDGERHVVKVSSPDEPQDILEFETDMIARLSADTDGLIPALVASRSGSELVVLDGGEEPGLRIRVVDFLSGGLLADVNPRSESLLVDVGARVAQLGSALGAYPDHPPARIDFDWALGSAGAVMEKNVGLLTGSQRSLIESTLKTFRTNERDLLGLGSQIIHGDINDHNVLVSLDASGAHRVSGVIDLGDAHSAPRVFDLAIAVAYAILGTNDPISAAAAVTRGYYEAQPLLDVEMRVLMTLVRARLGQSVCIAARRKSDGSTDPYHLVSEAGAWAALASLAEVSDRLGTAILHDACGLEPCPRSARLRTWLAGQSFEPVMALPDNASAVGVLDLSVSSPHLTGRDTDDTADFSERVFRHMRAEGLQLGVGRFLEPRAFYLTDAFAGRSGDPRERRTIHLGIDLFDEPGASVHAPLPGRVHSVRDNDGRLDYGPTVILEHDGPSGPFWTLYGHLQRTSVGGLSPGDSVEAGQLVARIGPFPENGDWPPHLHFQIITDLLDYDGEFPGVALPRERRVWASFSPDPNLILGLSGETTFTEPEDLSGRRSAVLAPSLSLSYEEPLHIVRGRGTYLYDVFGREYLDCVNNVAHVGHEDPDVVRAGRLQMGVLNTNSRYLHESVLMYAERLVAALPDPLAVCLFVNSGTEANELALRMARAHTGGTGVVVLEGGCHGSSQALIDVSHYKFAGHGGEGAPDWVRAAPMPDAYRGKYRRNDPARATKYAEHIGEGFAELREASHAPAAYLSEAILCCGGQIEPPQGYLAAAYEHARASGALCIADEVQTGFGRVGSHMWGFETQGVVPDIVTLGKPIGNGHPIGAVVTTREIAASFDNGMEFFSTFGGNPVSAEIGLAVLDVLDRDELQDRAAAVGNKLKASLTELAERHEPIGEVRGRGLFLGIEFVQSRETLEPAPGVAEYVVARMKERGILLSTDSPDRNVIKFKPPMTFSESDGDRLVHELDAVLTHDFVVSSTRSATEPAG